MAIGKKLPCTKGFPRPCDVQDPRPEDVLHNALFSRESAGNLQQNIGEYDFIVVGTGCTAFAFIDETLRINPHTRILCLERGGLLLPTHFQNLAGPFKNLIGGLSETYPWTLSEKTHESEVGFCHGYYPFFGGRSLFWSGWCPKPSIKSLRGFPSSMMEAARQPNFWPDAQRLLNVFSTANVDDDTFGVLQNELSARLALPLPKLACLESSEPAQLAASDKPVQGKTAFSKFCAAEALLRVADVQSVKARSRQGADLDILLDCPVESIRLDDERNAIGINTARGVVPVNDGTRIVLCAGAVPNTTILCNSVPGMSKTAGKRLTGHFISHLTCRIPTKHFLESRTRSEDLQIAAQCILGYHPISGRQFQVQITAVHSPNPHEQRSELMRKCPDMSASAHPEHMIGSEQYVVFLCAIIGEFAEDNEQCWIRHQAGKKDRLTNIELQYVCNDDDYELWSYMEESAFQIISTGLASNDQADRKLEFWSRDRRAWTTAHPSSAELRISGVVHEASSTFVGAEEDGGSLDELYRPHGVNKVHVTGAGLFPTAGAWNPTLPMCAFAQHLAQMLQE